MTMIINDKFNNMKKYYLKDINNQVPRVDDRIEWKWDGAKVKAVIWDFDKKQVLVVVD